MNSCFGDATCSSNNDPVHANIRIQFGEQLKLLEGRTDTQVAVLGELGEFYRRRAEIELDYSRNLEKLAKQTASKHKAEKQKREAWAEHSIYTLWQDLIEATRAEARDRSCMADLYSNHVNAKLANHGEDIQRIARKCRDIGAVAHQEISRVLNELHTAMKTYQICHTESMAAETKFRAAELQKVKFEEAHPNKVGNSRKYRYLEKEFEKRHGKYSDVKLKSLRARNEYLMCVDAANAALHKYFADDLSDLIDCMDLGLQQWLAALLATVLAARKSVVEGELESLARIRDFAEQMDPRADKQKFIEANHSVFMLPRRFEFRPHGGDEVRQVSAQRSVQDELIQRYRQMDKRLEDLRLETEEVWKTLETAEKRVLELQQQPVVCIADLFSGNGASTASNGTLSITSPYAAALQSQDTSIKRPSCRETETHQQKRRQDLAETEDFYLQKFQHYILTENLVRRLQARREDLRKALGVRPPVSPTHGGIPVLPTEANAHLWRISSIPSNPSSPNHQSANPANGQAQRSPNDVQVPAQVGQISRPGRLSVGTRQDSVEGSEGAPATPSSCCSDTETGNLPNRPPSLPPKPRKKRIGASAKNDVGKRPKLFGGSLEEYVEATGEEIPLIVRSCIKALSQHALHHQGVFRVSGSQLEINAMKEAFERGEDPLVDSREGMDVNSVAGVLKLYFRELREPLFPIYMFDQFTDCTSSASNKNDKEECLLKLGELLGSLTRPVFLVMRYLFGFLSHLSEFSDENMMDPYNLAICFGPTLMPIPDGKDQVVYHNHVNELMRNFITFNDDLFPRDGSGPVYEKYFLIDCDDLTEDIPDDQFLGEEKDLVDSVDFDDGEDTIPSGAIKSKSSSVAYRRTTSTEGSTEEKPVPAARQSLMQTSVSLDESSADFPLIDEEDSPLSDLSAHQNLKAPDTPGDDDIGNTVPETKPLMLDPVPQTEVIHNHPPQISPKPKNTSSPSRNPEESGNKSAQAGEPLWLKRTSLQRAYAEKPVHMNSTGIKLNLHRVAPKMLEEQRKEKLLASSIEGEPAMLRSEKRRHSERVSKSGKLRQEISEDRAEIARRNRSESDREGPKQGTPEWTDSPAFVPMEIKRYSLQSDRPPPNRLSLSEYSPHYPSASNPSFPRPDEALSSPASLKDIQVELKAVLNSLEHFTIQAREKDEKTIAFLDSDHEKLPHTAKYAPDLVRNLPKGILSSSPPGDRGTSPSNGIAAKSSRPISQEPSQRSQAETFAETYDSTIKKSTFKEGSPALSDGGRSNGSSSSKKAKSPAPRPPVPRKPVAPTPPPPDTKSRVTVEKL